MERIARCRRAVEDELMRIAQEAVTNAVRHAEAKRVEIRLKFATAGVELTVAGQRTWLFRRTRRRRATDITGWPE